MIRPIVYDGLRLYLGALRGTPRGIDRVDFAYARFLFRDWGAECLGLLPTPWGMRLFDRARSLRMIDTLEDAWRETVDARDDPILARVRLFLRGERPEPKVSAGRHPGGAVRALRFLAANGLTLGRSAVRCTPRDSIYLNVGQLGWAMPHTTRWLRRRTDVRGVFLIHDVIPLQHPDFVSAGGRMAHRWLMDVATRHAFGLITTTRAASETVIETLRAGGCVPEARVAIHLPVAPVFLRSEAPDEALRASRYFIVCGAIETRKNHRMLLRVWARLIQDRGPSAPKLIVVGSPAHEGAAIVRDLAAMEALATHVFVVSGLASPALRRLMANAVGLLAPSLSEGFGLPVIEALAAGTPVIASDIAEHKEAGGALPIYLSPFDEDAWRDAISRMLDRPEEGAMSRERVAAFQLMTEANYFREVKSFFQRIS
jgi:glycosyltransferase involved in cell wall biosynthesis